MKAYEGHSGEMQGVRCYGDHCRRCKRACVPGSLELGVVNGMTYLLQDYIRRGICEVNVDEWDDRIIVQVIVYDDVVEQKRYKTVRDMFPDTALKATRDNKTWEKLSKPINVLVELGSKDSVEYRNSEEYKKEHQNQTNTGKNKEMNLEEAMKNPDALAGRSADDAYSALFHVSEVIRRSDLDDDARLHAVYAIEAACRAYLDAKACEKAIVNSDDWCRKAPEEETDPDACEEAPSGEDQRKDAVPDAPVPVECERKRYAGDAMIRDYISRHSRYDLKGVDFRIPLVEWVDNVDGHDVWRAFVTFLIEGKLTESSFKFSEAGSAIANSAMAFDYMVSCLPNLGLRFKEEK